MLSINGLHLDFQMTFTSPAIIILKYHHSRTPSFVRVVVIFLGDFRVALFLSFSDSHAIIFLDSVSCCPRHVAKSISQAYLILWQWAKWSSLILESLNAFLSLRWEKGNWKREKTQYHYSKQSTLNNLLSFFLIRGAGSGITYLPKPLLTYPHCKSIPAGVHSWSGTWITHQFK